MKNRNVQLVMTRTLIDDPLRACSCGILLLLLSSISSDAADRSLLCPSHYRSTARCTTTLSGSSIKSGRAYVTGLLVCQDYQFQWSNQAFSCLVFLAGDRHMALIDSNRKVWTAALFISRVHGDSAKGRSACCCEKINGIVIPAPSRSTG